MKKNLGLFLAIILVQIAPFISAADTLHPLIYKIDIKKEISNTTRLYLSNGLAEAYALGADAVLIHMNTYGGQVDAADSMRTAILYNPIPVYVFIDNNAENLHTAQELGFHVYMPRPREDFRFLFDDGPGR